MPDYLGNTRRSVAWFKQVHDAGNLTMRPPFQRNPVWTETQQSLLIDSILRGYPIPELYLQDSVTADGTERHVVVDGQQRLRACLEFIEGRFALDPGQVPTLPDQMFDDLTPDTKKIIYSYNFIVRLVPEVPDEELRVVFQRLNRNNIVLNQQELRHATYWGSFIKSMEALAELDYWSSSGIFTTNDVRRMLDIEFISELTVAHLHGLQNKKAGLDKWYNTYETDFPDRTKTERVFLTVLGELSQALPGIAQSRWRKKSDFYTLFLLLASHEGSLPLTKPSRARLAQLLTKFGEAVDKYLSQGGSAPSQVPKYADAVERAASDLNNRRARAEALAAQLKPVLKN